MKPEMKEKCTGSKLALLRLHHMFEAKHVLQNDLEYAQMLSHFPALKASGHERFKYE